MSCDYPADWPVAIHRWRRGEPIDEKVITAVGEMRGRSMDEQIDAASRTAAREYVGAAGADRASRLQVMAMAYRLQFDPGTTLIQTAERYLLG